MLELFKKKTPGLLGIDISTSSIKLLELSQSANGKYIVENYAARYLPEGAVIEKNISNLDVVGETLYKLATTTKTKTKDAAVAVSGSAVITKVIELNNNLSDSEMENQIIVEADQYIPYPLDEVAIDFERQQVSPKNEDVVEVLLAACKKENVDLRVSALDIGGFDAKAVDIEAYAIERGYQLLQQQMDLPDSELVAIFDVGASMTTLYVLRNGASIYTREQVFGGSSLSKDVQNRYNLSPEKAVASIMDDTLPDEYAVEILHPFKEEISEQISRSLQFFFSSSQYNDVDLIVLAGGVAATKGLAKIVEEGVSTKTIVANPFAKMKFSKKVNKAQLENDASSLIMACGLAVRGLQL